MNSAREWVVVVHGFATPNWVMRPLARKIEKAGYSVHRWTYPSFFSPIAPHAARFRKFLQQDMRNYDKVHVVTHSMGAIILRAAMALDSDHHSAFPNLGRVVMIAPPNLGSPMARWFSPILGWVFQPIRDLSTHPESYVNQLPAPLGLEIGIIAGKFDALVPPSYTRLPVPNVSVVQAASHNSFLISSTTAKLAIRFLKSGSFEPNSLLQSGH